MGMDRDDINSKLKNILTDLLGIDETTPDEEINQDSIGEWDSSMHLTIIMEIEAQFKISFNIEQVTAIRSLEDILYYLEQKLMKN